MQPNREQVLRDAIFRAIEIVTMEWDVTFEEILNALHTTRKAIKRQLLIEGRDTSDNA